MGLGNVESPLQQHAKDNMTPPASDIIPSKQTSIFNFTLRFSGLRASPMLDCDMSFTLASPNPIQGHGQAVNQCSLLIDDILHTVKGLLVVWEKLHKGFIPFRWQRTCLH